MKKYDRVHCIKWYICTSVINLLCVFANFSNDLQAIGFGNLLGAFLFMLLGLAIAMIVSNLSI